MLKRKINEKAKPLFLIEQIVTPSPNLKSGKNLRTQKSPEKQKTIHFINKETAIKIPPKNSPKIQKSTPAISKKIKFVLFKKKTPILQNNIIHQKENKFLSKKRNENHTKKSFRFLKSPLNNGRWNQDEQKLFINTILEHGNNWKKIQNHFITRSCTQIRSHAQKFLLKLKENQYLRDKGLDPEFCWSKAMSHLKNVLSIEELKKIFYTINESNDIPKSNINQTLLTEKSKNQNSTTTESVENKNDEEKLNEEKNNIQRSNNINNNSTEENSKKNDSEKIIKEKFDEDNYDENNYICNFSPDFSCFNNIDFFDLSSNNFNDLNKYNGIELYEESNFNCMKNENNIITDDLLKGFRDRNLDNNKLIYFEGNLLNNNITNVFHLNENENNFNTFSENNFI